jgi:hypothetical protein
VALAAVASVGVSAAAKLNVQTGGGTPLIKAWSRCSGQVKATITGASVAVTGIDSACSGTTLVAYVRSGSSTMTASTTVSGTTATLTLPSAPATVSGAIVTAGTWPLPTVWEQTQSTLPAVSCSAASGTGTCTATVTGIDKWGYPTLSDYNLTVTVSSSSTTPVTWQVTINLSSIDLPFVASDLSDTQGGLVKVSATACSATPRTVTVKGTTSWGNYHQVQAGQTSSLQVHGATSGSGGLVDC